ncbi:MAG: hypothetical protein ACLGG0_14270 [Bacteriovoracia bacterium]
MSIGQKRSNLAAVLSLISLSVSCVSTPKSVEAPPICSRKLATQKYVWTVAFSQRVPKNIELSKVSDLVKHRSDLQDNVTDSFVGGLIYLSSNNGSYSSQSRSQHNHALNPQARYLAEERSAALIETGASNFIFCIWDECQGLKDPQTGSEIQKYYDSDFAQRAGAPVRPMYYVEGIVDASDSRYNDHKTSSYNAPSPAYVEWSDYFERRPFAGGNLLNQHYFNIPVSKRSEFCLKAGLEKNCFELPKYDFRNDIVTFLSCNIRGGDCLTELQKNAPFRFQFLSDNNGLCGTSCRDDINTMLEKLRNDPHFRLQWEDAISKDIFLKVSTSITRKVEKNWIIHRIEWNPTFFCQYARPKADLITQ